MSERQMKVSLSSIRGDHLKRYEYARDICSGKILDAACGVGYGSFIMKDQARISSIDAVDISEEALVIASDAWKNPKTTFYCSDVNTFEFKSKYDWLVSFETIEHVPNVEVFLSNASINCKNIICSVPNEDVIPFDKSRFPFHLRHYKPAEIKELLEECGFDIHTVKYQKTRENDELTVRPGRTIILEGVSKTFKEIE